MLSGWRKKLTWPAGRFASLAKVGMVWLRIPALFFFAAVIQTWPLIRRLPDGLVDTPSQPGDTGSLLWSLWWFKRAVVDFQVNPYHTGQLFYPQGADLYLHALTPLNGLMAVPILLFTDNMFLTWNLLALVLFTLSGLSMYALARHVTGRTAPALFAGFIFAFSPRILAHFQGGEWNISTVWLLPLFMLFLIRLRETGRLKHAAAAAAMWSLISYNWLEYGVDAGLFFGLFVLFWSVSDLLGKDWRSLRVLWRGAAAVAVMWLALTSWLIVQTLRSIDALSTGLPGGDEFWSADLLSFVTPSPLWGSGTAPTPPSGSLNPIGSIEGTSYLGFIPLLLAGLSLFAIKQSPRQVLFWLIVLLFFATLSLGPYLYVDGSKHFSILGISGTVPLPYQLYDKLPLLSERRVSSRLIVYGLPALSVLSALGFGVLMSRVDRHARQLLPLAVIVVFAGGVLDYWSPPVHFSPLSEPAIFQQIKKEEGDFSVLHVPVGRADGSTLVGDGSAAWLNNYYQTVHKRPVFGGYLSRAQTEGFDWIVKQPGLRYLSCAGCYPELVPEDLDEDAVRAVFKQYRIRYVVVHNLTPQEWQLPIYGNQLQLWDQYLHDVVGLEKIYEDRVLALYTNPEPPD